MAVWKGLEPSTSRVTGGRSNQLNYQTIYIITKPAARVELATHRLQGGCSTTELSRHLLPYGSGYYLVIFFEEAFFAVFLTAGFLALLITFLSIVV